MADTAHLRKHYAQLATEELLSFELDDLAEEAQVILSAELDARRADPDEAHHFRKMAGSPFKLDTWPTDHPPLPKGPPYFWLKESATQAHHMGAEREETLAADLQSLRASCSALQLELPQGFLLFMNSPSLWKKFRSVNGGFFDLRRQPVRCPTTHGYLIPFISDQQYCHFYLMHLTPGKRPYEIVWADATYTDALYATPELFAINHEHDFDASDIHLCNVDFEAFMWNHYHDHEKRFAFTPFQAVD